MDSFPKTLKKFSTRKIAQEQAYKYLGKTAKLYPAKNKSKKYRIFDPKNKKWVHFGQMGYEDYTKHHDKTRRKNYLTRSRNIRGHWKNNKYSPNNLSIHILW
jgi:DNA modification methylase